MNLVEPLKIEEVGSDQLLKRLEEIKEKKETSPTLLFITHVGTSEYDDDNDFLVDSFVTVVYSMELYCLILPSSVDMNKLLSYLWELKDITYQECPYKCATFDGSSLNIEGCPVALKEYLQNIDSNVLLFPRFLIHPSFLTIPQGMTCRDIEKKISLFQD